MEIEELGELKAFETMPKEGTLYVSIVCYGVSYWACGPSAMSKGEVIKALSSWSGATKARIYSIKVPLAALDAA